MLDQGIIGQLMLFTSTWKYPIKNWIPCDGRSLKYKDYPALGAVLNAPIPEGVSTRVDEMPEDLSFNVPNIPSPDQNYIYYICAWGNFPVRD